MLTGCKRIPWARLLFLSLSIIPSSLSKVHKRSLFVNPYLSYNDNPLHVQVMDINHVISLTVRVYLKFV